MKNANYKKIKRKKREIIGDIASYMCDNLESTDETVNYLIYKLYCLCFNDKDHCYCRYKNYVSKSKSNTDIKFIGNKICTISEIDYNDLMIYGFVTMIREDYVCKEDTKIMDTLDELFYKIANILFPHIEDFDYTEYAKLDIDNIEHYIKINYKID